MIQTIVTESNKEIKLSSSAAFLYIYKNQFKREPLKDLMNLAKSFEGKSENMGIEDMDLEVIQNITWALAKCADKSIKEPIEFYLENYDFLPMDHIEKIIDVAMASMTSTVKINEKN